MSKPLVAVCGATGQQGGGTLQALLKLGTFRVRALTRDPASGASQKISKQGAEVLKADFDDPVSLQAAFEGATAVFAVTDFWKACQCDPFKEIAQGKNIIDAAKVAGVKHVVWSTLEDTRPLLKDLVKPVTADFTTPHFDTKHTIEAYLREQMPGRWSCVLPGAFYDNFLPGKDIAPTKQPDGSFIIALPTGDAKLAWCAAADIGNVAAAVIAGGPEMFAGQTVGVAGDHLTFAEVGEKLSKVTGKTVVAVTPPPEAYMEQLKSYGVPEVAAQDLANMCLFYEKGDMLTNRQVEDTKAVYPGVQDLDAWLVDHKQAFLDGMA